MALIRSLATVGGYTGLSRVLGFVRDILIAAVLGTGPVADAFFVAFKLPNLFRRLFAEGAFNAAFVPLFAKRLEQEGEAAAKAFAEHTLAVLMTVVAIVCVLSMLAMPWLMYGLAPGFEEDPEKFALTVELSRITFPYLLFMSLVALLSGILNSLYRFAAAAAAPVLLNICFIVALLLVLPFSGMPGHLLAWTVAVAGVGQFLMLIIAASRAGMSLRLRLPRLTDGVRRLLALMLPGMLSAGAIQINLLIGTIIATLQAGAVSYLYYADRVYQLPLGLIGIAFGVVLLPDLSRKLRAGADEAAMHSLNRGLELAMLLTLPAAVALVIIPEPITIVLFERGAFDRTATEATSLALAAFAAGLPAFVLIKIFQPAFYAREDTVTPLKVALISIALNVVLSLALFWPFGHVGIAIATSVSAWLHALLLGGRLGSLGYLKTDQALRRRLPRIAVTAVVMGIALWFGAEQLGAWFEASQELRILALGLLVGGGLILYAGLALVSGAADREALRGLLRRRAKSQPD